MSALTTMGKRLGRDATIYGAGSSLGLLIALVQLIVLTRLMPPAEFGTFVVLVVVSEVLTKLYTLAAFQGGLGLGFGVRSEDDDDGDDEDGGGGGPPAALADKQRALGTALVYMAILGALGTVAAAVFARPLTQWLPGDPAPGVVIMAVAAAAFHAVFRPAATIPRYERRPAAYVIAHASQNALILCIAVPLVASGGGAGGAVTGYFAGTAIAAFVALWVTRRNYRLCLDFRLLGRVLRRGGRFVPFTLSRAITAHIDVLLLAQFATLRDIGLYRVASRAGVLVAFPISAFLLSWLTMQRQPIAKAVRAERGPQGLATMLATYFCFATIGLALGLVVGAQVLVEIAPPEYGGAARLIPLIGFGIIAQSWFVVAYRAAAFPRKYLVYVLLTILSCLIIVGASFVLIPARGPEGAAVALIIGPVVAGTILLAISQLGSSPAPYAYGRILAAAALAGALGFGERALGPLLGPWEPAAALLALILYPGALLGLRIVSPHHRRVLAGLLWPRRLAKEGAARPLLEVLDELGAEDLQVLEMVVKQKRPLAEVAGLREITHDAVAERVVAALRRVSGGSGRVVDDARLGRHLFSDAPIAQRHLAQHFLIKDGVDPYEIDQLIEAIRRLRRLPKRRWRRVIGIAEPEPLEV